MYDMGDLVGGWSDAMHYRIYFFERTVSDITTGSRSEIANPQFVVVMLAFWRCLMPGSHFRSPTPDVATPSHALNRESQIRLFSGF